MEEGRIAYCGVDCSACPDFASGKCPDCRHTDWQEGDICLPVECCRKKGITVCGKCPSFPCNEMRGFYGESESHARAYDLMLSLGADREEPV